MKVTILTTRKTKKAADRLAAIYAPYSEELNFRVVERHGVYHVIRDWHPSDDGRSFETFEEEA